MKTLLMKTLISLCIFASVCGTSFGDGSIVTHNGVQCYRTFVSTPGSLHKTAHYEPVPVIRDVPHVEPYVEDVINEEELLSLDEDSYQDRLLQIIADAQRDQSRRADITLLKTLGLRFDSDVRSRDHHYIADRSISARGHYPDYRNFGISVIESADYVGKDPTDVLLAQSGRVREGLKDLLDDANRSLSDNLLNSLVSRNANVQAFARAAEKQAEGQADVAKIDAIRELLQRVSVNRNINIDQELAAISNPNGFSTRVDAQADLDSIFAPKRESSEIQKVVTQKCGSCHDPSSAKYSEARIDLSHVDDLDEDTWYEIVRMVGAEKMPPSNADPLTERERNAFKVYYADSFIRK